LKLHLPPNFSSDHPGYNATISACGKGLEWQLALMLFQDMGAAALPSDFFAYSAVSWWNSQGSTKPRGPKKLTHRAETQVHRRLDQKSPKTPGSKNRWRFWNPKSSDVLLYFCRNSRPDPSWVIWHLITTRSFRRLLRPRLEVKFTSCKTGFEVTSESASRTAENDADGLLGHPKNAKASLFCVKWPLLHPAMLQPSFSPTDGENAPLRSAEFFLSCPGGILHCFQKRRFRNLQKLNVIFQNRRSYSETMSDSETCFCCIEKLTPLVPQILFSNYMQLHGLGFISGCPTRRLTSNWVTSHRPWRTSLGVLSQVMAVSLAKAVAPQKTPGNS